MFSSSDSQKNPENGGNVFLKLVGIQPQDYMLQQPGRPQSEGMLF